jgi:AcrR family transcriptional regulator
MGRGHTGTATSRRPRRRSATRTRLDVGARREQLLQIGAELFSERAYEDVWIDEIATAAGVSKGLLYHYFPSKRDFVSAVARAEIARIHELTEPDPGLPLDEQLHTSVETLLAYLEQHPAAFIAFHRGAFGADPDLRAIDEAGHAAQVDRIVSAVVDDQQPPDVLRLAIRGWTGFVEATVLNWLESGRTVPRERVRDLLVTALAGILQSCGDLDDPPTPQQRAVRDR